jgi:8-oxo-dGTP pyrophosphatase MutT (NUDIX family)
MIHDQADGSNKMVAIPKKATTVILLRERKPEGFEVFLLKRHEKSSFMGGNYVYPGGRVDRDDGTLEIRSLCRGITSAEAHQIFGGSIPTEEGLAFWIAGIRELFEESGVLLAYDQKGKLLQLRDREEREKFLHYRELLQRGKINISEMAQKENLLFALDQLHYYAHWITPEARPERFDTCFLLARYPFGQEASHDQKETTAGAWLTPQEALMENLEGEVVLSPPTLKTLEDLARFKSIEDLFSSLKKAESGPILPILTKISENPLLIFPWDPEYDIYQKGEIPSPINHGRPSQPGDNTTRLLMRKNRWLPYCRT